MGDEKSNSVRDQLLASAPQHRGKILGRDAVVEKWCNQHGVTKDELSIEQILEIRKLPEWQNAS